MKSALIHTENGLQVRVGAARCAHANRVHRQPEEVVFVGRNSMELAELATRTPTRSWEDTYCTPTVAARFLGYKDFRDLRRYTAAGLLKAYYRPLSNRPLFRRADVEALMQPAGG